MAEARLPNAVTSEELDLKTVRVVLVVEGLEVEPPGDIKNADVNVDFKETSFCVQAEVHRKKGVVKYKQVIKKLPGEIDREKCTYKFKKDQIILDLKKKEECSWAVQLSTSGLEQASSDESD
ncbi:uncharacterized protein [Haliotis asinina]|uniref:uncharacterized protein isoform X1 n=1 Tax=Haliotis asinina TaxID=109174 RepID=UPI003531EAFF